MRDAGTAVINIGSGSGPDKVQKAISTTISHPLLDIETKGGKSALVHVTGGMSLTIEEATQIGAGVTSDLDEQANVIFGSRLVPELTDQIRVMSIVTGVKPRLGSEAARLTTSGSASTDTRWLDSIENLI